MPFQEESVYKISVSVRANVQNKANFNIKNKLVSKRMVSSKIFFSHQYISKNSTLKYFF